MIKMAHTENHHNDSPEINLNFSFLGSMNLYLVVAGAFGFPPHIFPCVENISKASYTMRSNEQRRFVDVTGFSGLFNSSYTNVNLPLTVQQLR